MVRNATTAKGREKAIAKITRKEENHQKKEAVKKGESIKGKTKNKRTLSPPRHHRAPLLKPPNPPIHPLTKPSLLTAPQVPVVPHLNRQKVQNLVVRTKAGKNVTTGMARGKAHAKITRKEGNRQRKHISKRKNQAQKANLTKLSLQSPVPLLNPQSLQPQRVLAVHPAPPTRRLRKMK